MKAIAMVNPKGGAGKTVSAVNIAYVLSDRGKKVLLVDADSRGAVSVYLGLENENSTLFHLIKEQYKNMSVQDFKKYIVSKNGVDIIVSDSELHRLDNYFIFENNDYGSLLDCIANLMYLFEGYDYVIFDTEGTVNNMTRAVLKAADYIFSPSKSSAIDINGLADIEVFLLFSNSFIFFIGSSDSIISMTSASGISGLLIYFTALTESSFIFSLLYLQKISYLCISLYTKSFFKPRFSNQALNAPFLLFDSIS